VTPTAPSPAVPQTRPLARSDRESLEKLVLETGAFSAAETDVAMQVFDEAFPPDEGDGDPDYNFLGAFDPTDSARLFGYVCFGPTLGSDRGYDLYWIAVHPAHQNSGIGSALMREVEARLAQWNARMLIVETSGRPAYESTRDFYVRRGYAEAARVHGFYAADDDRVLYTKRFGAS
jgi:ribosomal protein S18 acetylase RimI-like enzyme